MTSTKPEARIDGALIVVDVQQGFDDVAHWGERNNPACETNIAALIDAWRSADRPVVFVRHDSVEPDSPLRPDRPGNAFQPSLTGDPELLVVKSVHSAFHGAPNLDAWLRNRAIQAVTVCGITTNHCCETTARVACDLGYDVQFVIDATCTFDRADIDGVVIAADDIARVTAASLHGEFANVIRTEHLLADF